MEKLFKLLSDAQSSLFVLFHKTWAFHWNVVGSDFTQLHQLFGGQYETMFEEIDRLSEHMGYLNIKPLSSLSRMLEVTQIQEAASSTTANNMLSELLENNEKFCELTQSKFVAQNLRMVFCVLVWKILFLTIRNNARLRLVTI